MTKQPFKITCAKCSSDDVTMWWLHGVWRVWCRHCKNNDFLVGRCGRVWAGKPITEEECSHPLDNSRLQLNLEEWKNGAKEEKVRI